MRCTSVEKKRQGDLILLNIPSTNKLKERLEQEVGERVIDNEDGVKLILDLLETIYGSDEVLECYLRFRDLETKQRQVGPDVLDYVGEWEVAYGCAKDRGVELDEKCKAFKLLMTTNLEELDMKLVLSELDMKSEEGKKTLFAQVKTAIRKYHGAGSLTSYRSMEKTLFSEAQLPQLEEVFIAKGWTKPGASKKSKPRDEKSDNPEKRRKADMKWRKCFRCVKDCSHGDKKCDCPCSSHLISNCPKSSAASNGSNGITNKEGSKGSGPDIGLYSETLYSVLGLNDANTFFVYEVKKREKGGTE